MRLVSLMPGRAESGSTALYQSRYYFIDHENPACITRPNLHSRLRAFFDLCRRMPGGRYPFDFALRPSIGSPQEVMEHVVPVKIVPGNRIRVVHAAGKSEKRPLGIDRGNFSVRTPQIPVVHRIRVDVDPGDRTRVVESYRTIGVTASSLVAASASAGSAERRKLALRAAQEAKVNIVRIRVGCRDTPTQIESGVTIGTTRALITARDGASTRNVELCYGAVQMAYQAVSYEVTVHVVSPEQVIDGWRYFGYRPSRWG
jgi:hypothetical protein